MLKSNKSTKTSATSVQTQTVNLTAKTFCTFKTSGYLLFLPLQSLAWVNSQVHAGSQASKVTGLAIIMMLTFLITILAPSYLLI